VDKWAHPHFQRCFPSLRILTIYQDWSEEAAGRDLCSTLPQSINSSCPNDVNNRLVEYIKNPDNRQLVISSRLTLGNVDFLTRSRIDYTWEKVQKCLEAPVTRQFKIEFTLYVDRDRDAILHVEEPEMPVTFIGGLPCERNHFKRMEYMMKIVGPRLGDTNETCVEENK
jgi:hypothetical protein